MKLLLKSIHVPTMMITLVILGTGTQVLAAPSDPHSEMIARLPPSVSSRQYWSVGAGTGTHVTLGGYSTSAILGYQPGYLGFDVRYTLGSTSYSHLHPQPDGDASSTDFGSLAGAGSELNRPRKTSDGWNFRYVEVGFPIEGRLTYLLPRQWTERARFGIARGTFTDTVNSVSFTAWLFTFEADLQYYFSKDGAWAANAGLRYSAGRLLNTQKATNQEGQLPALMMQWSAGLTHWFSL